MRKLGLPAQKRGFGRQRYVVCFVISSVVEKSCATARQSSDTTRNLERKGIKFIWGKLMKNNQSVEDYLECILLLSQENEYIHRVDVARKIGVSQPAVQKAIKILQEHGYVECDGLHIYLTKTGEEYASRVYERHCTLTKFLSILGVNGADAENDACEIEHVISDATFKAIKKFISDK